MNNIQSHFAKYLGKYIWDELNEKQVILTGIRKENLQYRYGHNEYKNGFYSQFKILAKSESEVINNNIPSEIAVIKVSKINVIKPVIHTPDSFLQFLKDKIYSPRNLTDEIMWKNRKKRNAIYRLPRQIIMACYFCAFENKGVGISLTKAGKLYEKDHATVINAIKVVNNYLETHIPFREEYKDIFNKVNSINPKSRLKIYY